MFGALPPSIMVLLVLGLAYDVNRCDICTHWWLFITGVSVTCVWNTSDASMSWSVAAALGGFDKSQGKLGIRVLGGGVEKTGRNPCMNRNSLLVVLNVL
ncbi:hypothetical protein V8C42DRAFT_210306 [Trichoderma barbatum]